ncbi:hypothetical protein BSKO_04472 [Bryopsis sp. KO-2023]|nr:hypothetical protein BSKO_04472 [Bryopsis sp. KO-2023]
MVWQRATHETEASVFKHGRFRLAAVQLLAVVVLLCFLPGECSIKLTTPSEAKSLDGRRGRSILQDDGFFQDLCPDGELVKEYNCNCDIVPASEVNADTKTIKDGSISCTPVCSESDKASCLNKCPDGKSQVGLCSTDSCNTEVPLAAVDVVRNRDCTLDKASQMWDCAGVLSVDNPTFEAIKTGTCVVGCSIPQYPCFFPARFGPPLELFVHDDASKENDETIDLAEIENVMEKCDGIDAEEFVCGCQLYSKERAMKLIQVSGGQDIGCRPICGNESDPLESCKAEQPRCANYMCIQGNCALFVGKEAVDIIQSNECSFSEMFNMVQCGEALLVDQPTFESVSSGGCIPGCGIKATQLRCEKKARFGPSILLDPNAFFKDDAALAPAPDTETTSPQIEDSPQPDISPESAPSPDSSVDTPLPAPTSDEDLMAPLAASPEEALSPSPVDDVIDNPPVSDPAEQPEPNPLEAPEIGPASEPPSPESEEASAPSPEPEQALAPAPLDDVERIPSPEPEEAPALSPLDAADEIPSQEPEEAPASGPQDDVERTPSPEPEEAPASGPQDEADEIPIQEPEEAPTPAPLDDVERTPSPEPEEAPAPGPLDDADEIPIQEPEEAPAPGPLDDADEVPIQEPEEAPAPGPLDDVDEIPIQEPEEAPVPGPLDDDEAEDSPAPAPDFDLDEIPMSEPAEGPAPEPDFDLDDIPIPEPEEGPAPEPDFDLDDIPIPEPEEGPAPEPDFDLDGTPVPEPEEGPAPEPDDDLDDIGEVPAPAPNSDLDDIPIPEPEGPAPAPDFDISMSEPEDGPGTGPDDGQDNIGERPAPGPDNDTAGIPISNPEEGPVASPLGDMEGVPISEPQEGQALPPAPQKGSLGDSEDAPAQAPQSAVTVDIVIDQGANVILNEPMLAGEVSSGAWRDCSLEGKKERSVICRTSTGLPILDTNCNQGDLEDKKSEGVEDCQTETIPCDGCSKQCATIDDETGLLTGGTPIQTVNRETCGEPNEQCNTFPCDPVRLKAGPWTDCSCDSNTQTRKVDCVDGQEEVVDASLCDAQLIGIDTLPNERNCTASGCTESQDPQLTRRLLQDIVPICDGVTCSGHGKCSEDGVCECEKGFKGPDCQIDDREASSCPGGVLNADGECCQSGVFDLEDGTCCGGSSARLDKDGRCCDGQVDFCGVCEGKGVVDVQGKCCELLSSSGLCCESGDVDQCGVCNGFGATCIARLELEIDLKEDPEEFTSCLQEWIPEVLQLGAKPVLNTTKKGVDTQQAVLHVQGLSGTSQRLETDLKSSIKSPQRRRAQRNPCRIIEVNQVSRLPLCGNSICETQETPGLGGTMECAADCPFIYSVCGTHSESPDAVFSDERAMCGGHGSCYPAGPDPTCLCHKGFEGDLCDQCGREQVNVEGFCVKRQRPLLMNNTAILSIRRSAPIEAPELPSQIKEDQADENKGSDGLSVLLIVVLVVAIVGCVFLAIISAVWVKKRKTKNEGVRGDVGAEQLDGMIIPPVMLRRRLESESDSPPLPDGGRESLHPGNAGDPPSQKVVTPTSAYVLDPGVASPTTVYISDTTSQVSWEEQDI